MKHYTTPGGLDTLVVSTQVVLIVGFKRMAKVIDNHNGRHDCLRILGWHGYIPQAKLMLQMLSRSAVIRVKYPDCQILRLEK